MKTTQNNLLGIKINNFYSKTKYQYLSYKPFNSSYVIPNLIRKTQILITNFFFLLKNIEFEFQKVYWSSYRCYKIWPLTRENVVSKLGYRV